jgi:two-component system LytT family response regulator
MNTPLEKPIKLLIIDDEPLARRHVEQCLQNIDGFTIVDFCHDAPQALISIEKHQPDILLLDIEMPVMNGFELIEKLANAKMPYIIFITAYNQYAVNAFEINALDYILKPVTTSRLLQALQRYKTQAAHKKNKHYQTQLHNAIELMKPPQKQKTITVNDGEKFIILTIDDIKYIESAGNYVCINYQNEVHVIRQTLKKLVAQLDACQFRQIHRSTMVNIKQIQVIKPHINGEYILKLTAGERLKVSRTYKENIMDIAKKS